MSLVWVLGGLRGSSKQDIVMVRLGGRHTEGFARGEDEVGFSAVY